MGKYSDSEEWEVIVPVPQDDGGPNPLAAIAYTEEYSEAMSYLRAVMAKDEKSERILGLTEDIIHMNPAHYTVWYTEHPTMCICVAHKYAGFTEQTFFLHSKKIYNKSSTGSTMSPSNTSKTFKSGTAPAS